MGLRWSIFSPPPFEGRLQVSFVYFYRQVFFFLTSDSLKVRKKLVSFHLQRRHKKTRTKPTPPPNTPSNHTHHGHFPLAVTLEVYSGYNPPFYSQFILLMHCS